MNQARIKCDFGELVIEYSTLQELEAKLQEAKEAEQLVTSKIGTSLVHHAKREPKPGYEDVYRFLPDGTVELFLFPKKNVQKVALVLFAYDQAVPVSVIEKCTNIPNVPSKVLNQMPNRKYLTRTTDGKYALSPDGVIWVTSTVIPNLRKKEETE